MSRSYKNIRRVYITVPIEDRTAMIEWCYNKGYAITQSGCPIEKFPKVNAKKFRIIAEKEIK